MPLAEFPRLYRSLPTGAFVRLRDLKMLCFSNHTIPAATKSSKWHDGPFHQTNSLCPFGALEIFFPHLQLPQIPSCYTHTCKFPHQSCSQFPAFSRTAPQPSLISIRRLSRSAPRFFFPSPRVPLYPHLSPHTCVFVHVAPGRLWLFFRQQPRRLDCHNLWS